MARPRREIDYDAVERYALIHCTEEEIATLIGFSAEGFRKRKLADDKLSGVLKKGYDEGKKSLRRLQWEQAQEGDRTMLIWLGKQLLGQRDKHEQTVDQTVTVNIQKPSRGE